MYQVEHITGRGGSGTEYTAPACAAMKTTGLCIRPDTICEKVNHPLSYYKLKKKKEGTIK
jgi:DNA primase large subunit